MLLRRALATLALLSACGGGSGDPAPGDGAADGPGAEVDGPAGTDGGGGPFTLTACDPGVRVDELRGVDGSSTMRFAGVGDRWVVTWLQLGLASPDDQYHLMGRAFDGATLGPIADLGLDNYGQTNPLALDGAGRAFLQHYTGTPSGQRAVIDVAAGTFGAETPFTLDNLGDTMAIAAYPAGGAISFYRTGAELLAERWTPAAPTWTGLALGPTPANAFNLRAATDATGRAAVLAVPNTADGVDVWIRVHDGATTWTPAATLPFPSGGGLPVDVQLALLGDGDVLLTWVQGTTLTATRLHPTAGTFDPPTPVATELASSRHQLLVDGDDRATLLYATGGRAVAVRDVGAGWGDAIDLGVASSAALVEDGAGHLAALTYDLPTLYLARLTDAAGDTFTPRIDTGIGISNGVISDRQAGVVFDAAGQPTVISMIDLPGAGGFGLAYATCR